MMWTRKTIPVLLLAWAVAGCETDEKPSTARQRQDAVIQDPFNYSPLDSAPSEIGGGTATWNKKAFKRDVNSVFNP